MLVEDLGRGPPAERLSRAGVQCSSDGGELVGAVSGEIGPFREVLAKQSVGVFVGAALPGAVRVAEVDFDAGVDPQRGARPSRRPGPRSATAAAAWAARGSRRRSRRARLRPHDRSAPDRSLRARRAAAIAAGEAASGSGSCARRACRSPSSPARGSGRLPVPGYGAVVGLGGPLADHDLRLTNPLPRPRVRARGTRSARPVRRQAVSSRRNAPRPCT